METKQTENDNIQAQQDGQEQQEERTYRCNDCGGVIHKHEIFCSKCGKLLDRYDFED
ncbi:MAG: hypothetical protein K6B45_05090 [Bacteroidaceae bacterium]|nr:hypothetical protein [Bacteroidaceae bacterium]